MLEDNIDLKKITEKCFLGGNIGDAYPRGFVSDRNVFYFIGILHTATLHVIDSKEFLELN